MISKFKWLFCIALINSSCLTTQRSSNPQIIGGEETTAYEAVGVLAQNAKDLCTASLIGPQLIVTAAHCVYPLKTGMKFSFHIGPRFSESKGFSIVECTPHSQYDDVSNDFDIALCRTAQVVPAKPLRVATKLDEKSIGRMVTIVGYGRREKPETGSGGGGGIKRKGTLKMVALSASKFKAESPGVSSCNGDSGGPAFLPGEDGEPEIAGIVSCGDFNCESYGVYTRADVFGQFLGLTPKPDFAGPLLKCPPQSFGGICQGSVLTSCKSDCFEAKISTKDCALVPQGSCYQYKERKTATCIDGTWRSVTFNISEVAFRNGQLEVVGPYEGDLFFDESSVHASTGAHGRLNGERVVTELLPLGPHKLQVRRFHSASSIGVSKPILFDVKANTQSVDLILGKIPIFLTVKGKLQTSESFYITGQTQVLGDWKTAFKLTKAGDGFLFQDLLPVGLEYKILKAKSSMDRIEIDSKALWQKGPNRMFDAPMLVHGVVETVTPEF